MQNPRLPKPDWLTLTEAVAEICDHGLEILAVRQTIHRLLQDARISSRCRCRSYYEDDNIHSVQVNKIPNIWTNIIFENIDFNKNIVRQSGIGRSAASGLAQTIISDILVSRTELLPLFSISLGDGFDMDIDTSKKKPRTGAKRMPIWDYMWAEMAHRVFKGEWSEDTKQSQAIKQMSGWLSTQTDEVPSDDSIKNRVSMLWNRLGWSGNK